MPRSTQSADSDPSFAVQRSKLKVRRSVSAAAIVARTVAGIAGGYALAAFFTTTVALLVRTPREEAAYLGAVPSFLVFAAAIVWAFTARTAVRAWAGIGLPALVLAALTWWLSRGSAA